MRILREQTQAKGDMPQVFAMKCTLGAVVLSLHCFVAAYYQYTRVHYNSGESARKEKCRFKISLFFRVIIHAACEKPSGIGQISTFLPSVHSLFLLLLSSRKRLAWPLGRRHRLNECHPPVSAVTSEASLLRVPFGQLRRNAACAKAQ
jgi:hypothetical protein